MKSMNPSLLRSSRAPFGDTSTVSAGIAEMRLSADAGVTLAAFGLGSCIGIAFYDRIVKVGAMLHAQLPFAADNRVLATKKPFAFVDAGIAATLDALTRHGARTARLLVWAAGGATLNPHSTVGDRNQVALDETLRSFGLYADYSNLGGSIARGIALTLPDGQIHFRYPTSGLHEIKNAP